MRTAVRAAVLAAWLAALAAWAFPAWAHNVAHPAVTGTRLLLDQDRKAYRAAFHEASKARFRKARKLARNAENRMPAKVIEWMRLAGDRPRGNFKALAQFLDENPEWPGQVALRRNAELMLPRTLRDEQLLSWFQARPPATPAGAARYAGAMMRAGQNEAATELLRATWVGGDFGRRDERAFRKRFSESLHRGADLARLDRLLWDGKYGPARRQARRLGKGYPALAEARIQLARRGPGVDAAISRVPADLKEDAGLVYERARWRRRKSRYKGVIELLDPPDPAAPRPELWWPLRKWAARQAIIEGDFSAAYRIARAHGLEAGLGFAEGEWLAGWIALRFLNQTKDAYEHFKRLSAGVTSPISLSRSAYWAGEAARALDRRDASRDWRLIAQRWYELAARFGTTFYGQLASQRLERPIEIETSEAGLPSPEARAAFGQRELVRVVRLLGELGETKLRDRFLLRLKTLAENAEDYALVAELAHGQGRSDIAVRTAKSATTAGFVLLDYLFPSRELPEIQGSEPALVLAVIRQESAFYNKAVSGAGARGLMQILPGIAKRIARRLKIGYNRKKLLTDPEYNLRLGRALLSDLTKRYDGSYVLALSAYNAGPARSNRWMKAFGDPRRPGVDPVDWIESIPFDETRNYVQRIIEALLVYRWRLGTEERPPVLVPSDSIFQSELKRQQLWT